jgi:hypothetical protein
LSTTFRWSSPLKADQAKGRHTLKIIVEDPMGARIPVGEWSVNFQPGNNGLNIIVDVNFAVQYEGVYWFDVILGGPRGVRPT